MAWYWQSQPDKTEQSPEISPQKHDQLIFEEGVKASQRRKDSLFSKWCWETGHLHANMLSNSYNFHKN